MDKKIFKQRSESEIMILDGVMGTMLQPHLPAGACIDQANLDQPDLVRSIYTAYVQAGTDLLSTNSFGATRIKLREYGLEAKTKEINYQAAKIAKNVARHDVWVAGILGPTGKLVEPLGDLSFDEAYDTFREQGEALAEGGVDLFLLETFSDLREIRAAIMAIQEHLGLPIIASMTYGDHYTTFTGTDPETAANVLSSLNVDGIGVNCSTGPEPMLEVLGRYTQATNKPLLVEPNAGIPRMEKRKTMFQITAEEMANFAQKFVQIGANIVGSCCGSTPEYTALLKKQIKGMKPVSRSIFPCLKISSRVRTVAIGSDLPFCVVGERINPTNREDLAVAIRHGKMELLQKEAQSQFEEGAHILDINIGVPGIDEAKLIGRIVRGIENVTKAPLSIDSTNPAVVEAALRESAGKVLINSVNGDEKSMQAILPLAKKYGAGVLCLAVNEKGIPKTAEARLSVIEKIVNRALDIGISRENLICDCLTLTVSAQQKRAEETLKAIRLVKEKLKLPTILGVSNISYGLPERSLINSTFISMAMASGLDAAILNPGDIRMIQAVRAASVLTVRDKDSKAFVASHQKKKTKKQFTKEASRTDDISQKITHAVISGNREEINSLLQQALDAGRTAIEINTGLLIPAIQEVGKKYDQKQIYLPQMILAAETIQKGFKVLEPHFKIGEVQSQGTVLICTVKGDVHDIGKNIVSLFIKNQGFHVIDLGKDVDTDVIIQKSKDFGVDVVALSALMTTTMVEMVEVIKGLKKVGLKIKVIVGGAVVTKRYANEIGADGYAKDGVSAVEIVRELIQQS